MNISGYQETFPTSCTKCQCACAGEHEPVQVVAEKREPVKNTEERKIYIGGGEVMPAWIQA